MSPSLNKLVKIRVKKELYATQKHVNHNRGINLMELNTVIILYSSFTQNNRSALSGPYGPTQALLSVFIGSGEAGQETKPIGLQFHTFFVEQINTPNNKQTPVDVGGSDDSYLCCRNMEETILAVVLYVCVSSLVCSVLDGFQIC